MTIKTMFPKTLMAASLMLLAAVTLTAQIPDNYYQSTQNLTGEELKESLHLIVRDHITYPYTSDDTDVWDILKVADRDPENPENVLGIYSEFSMNAELEYNGGSGWNREHIWPQSKGEFGTSEGAGTDVHHLRASDISTNSARSNRFFDIAPNPYYDEGGFHNGPTDCYTSSDRWVWEPRDEVKGDIARMIFYMAVRYEGTNGETDLELTDEILPSDDNSPLMGKASRLIEWHIADPVSDAERERNDIIYSYQNNRNPFIDKPEYVCLIWPQYCDQSTQDGELFISEYIEGTSWNKGLEIANTTDGPIDLTYYILKKQTDGSGDWGSEFPLSGTLNSGEVYTLAHSEANSLLTSKADTITSKGIMTFNGNDPVALFYNQDLIDIAGSYNAGSEAWFGQEVTLVRKSSIISPKAEFSATEWEEYPENTFEYYGSHDSTPTNVFEEKSDSQSEITISYKPNGIIYVKHSSQTILCYSLYNINGRLLAKSFPATQDFSLKLSDYSRGIYLLRISTAMGSTTLKVMAR